MVSYHQTCASPGARSLLCAVEPRGSRAAIILVLCRKEVNK